MKKITAYIAYILIMVVIAASTICFVACSSGADDKGSAETEEAVPAEEPEESEEPGEAPETEVTEMSPEMVSQLAELLGCPERTAQGFCNTISKSLNEEVTGFKMIDDPYSRVVEITGASGCKYYAVIEKGWFLSRITADSIDGETVYIAIQ